MPSRSHTSGRWHSEPFRAFFPLGIIASILGVMTWPLFYAGWWQTIPQIMHPRLMIFGFGGAFVTGFLGTAFPRFVEAEPIEEWEFNMLVVTWALSLSGYLLAYWSFGDLMYFMHGLMLLAFLNGRALRGADRPGIAFLIAAGGVVLGMLAAITWFLESQIPAHALLLTRLMAFQGLLLLPLLGLGSIMIPRFFATSIPAPGMNLGLKMATAVVLISFAVEAYGWPRSGNLFRFFGMVVWAIYACPTLLRAKASSTRAWAIRLALAMLAGSFLIRAAWLGPGYAVEHLLFLCGFAVTILLIADRVTLGHSNCLPDLNERSKRWRWLFWLLVLTAATRISADMKASLMVSHHIYAALLWTGIVIAWALPHIRRWKEKPHD